MKLSTASPPVPAIVFTICILLTQTACGGSNSSSGSSSNGSSSVLSNYHLTGATTPIRDPSIMRQAGTYYLFSTDAGGAISGHLPIRCSTDKMSWQLCGAVFNQIPAWVQANEPGITDLWAPDISFFNGLYHVYYAGSIFATNTSVIGLATNTTLDPTDPAYQWIDQGLVLSSSTSDDFNAIDPSILVDTDGSVWMTYGSYWTGIKQQQVDPSTGELMAGNQTVYSLATRPAFCLIPLKERLWYTKTTTTICSPRLTIAAIRIRTWTPTESWLDAAQARMDRFLI